MIIDRPASESILGLRALWKEAFGDGDEFLDLFFDTAFSLDRCRCVYIDGKPVAALYWFDCSYDGDAVAYLYAVATAKSHRGKGLCSALMEDAHRHLKQKGYAGAALVPGEKELFDFYAKRGYDVCGRVIEYQCAAAKEGLDLREIDAKEYGRQRRRLLPENGIIQEKENLEFLQKQARFYTGDGFLLAARHEDETLYGLELLGNADLSPAIVRTLGCTEGHFRRAVTKADKETGRPFAMYLSLSDSKKSPPAYFGLAFD